MFDLRAVKVLVLGALAMLLVLTLPSFSTAVFTSTSSSTATVGAAADWTPPTVHLAGLPPYLRGVATLQPSAWDERSNIAQLTVEHRGGGTSSWTNICSEGTSSYSCPWDTTGVPDGRYVVQATATDSPGYTASTSADVTVDNTAPSVVMLDPGGSLRGTESFRAEAYDATSGVVFLQFQAAPDGTNTWADLCSVSAAPWACDVDTTQLANGAHSFRAVATDAAGNVTMSEPVTGRQIDNAVPLRGADVQATNTPGGTPGMVEKGDSITFTFAGRIDPVSVRAGWDGAAADVEVSIVDQHQLQNSHDVFVIDSSVNLGWVSLEGDFVHNNQTLVFDGAMTHQIVTVNGREHSTVTIVLGARTSGNQPHVRTADPAQMIWTDPLGNRVYETGPQDRDF